MMQATGSHSQSIVKLTALCCSPLQVALTLTVIRTEAGLLRYLKALTALRGYPHFNRRLGTLTKVGLLA